MAAQSVRLVYFAWLRERLDMGSEDVVLPETVTTVSSLLAWQKTRGETFEHAFEHADIIRVALDQQHVQHDDNLGSPREIALFPPMTGG